MLLPTGKPHVSFSEIRDWMECPFRHKLKHVDKIDLSTPSHNLAFGTACHAMIESFLGNKTLDPEVGIKMLNEEWEKHKEVEDFKKADKEKLILQLGHIMLDTPKFLDENFPGWELMAAEETLYEDLKPFFEKHEGLSFKGFIDCVLKVPGKKEGEFLYWLLDWKTANRPWALDKIKDEKTRLQLVLYKKFWSTKHDVPLKDIRCGFVTILKQGKPGKLFHLIPISVGDITAGRSLTIINNSLTSIKKGMTVKNRKSCTYCDYKQTEHCP